MVNKNELVVFDYRGLRFVVGLIALTLPVVVFILSSAKLSSISASYHTEARDTFTGLLVIIASFLFAYNGHSLREAIASKVASLATILVVMFPTSCDACKTDIKSATHYVAAVILFAILAYFCFGPFRRNTKGRGGKKGLRSRIYCVCGSIIVGSMLGVLLAKVTLSDEMIKTLSVTYWAETLMLLAFGIAWIVAGKILPPLVDKDEAYRPSIFTEDEAQDPQ